MFKFTNDLYNQSAQKFGQQSGAIMAPNNLHELRMKAAVELLSRHIPPKVTILDIGCGYGALLDYLEEDQYRTYTGIDPNAMMLDLARARHPECAIRSYRLGSLGSPELFDLRAEYVVCLGVAVHLMPEVENLHMFAGMLSSMATRGVIVEFQNAEKYKGAFTSWTKDQVSQAFGRRISPLYTVENEEDSTFTCCFALQ